MIRKKYLNFFHIFYYTEFIIVFQVFEVILKYFIEIFHGKICDHITCQTEVSVI